MARISLDKLSFTYPGADTATLSKVDLTIEDGEAHALLGASGAGKTTLLNILSGLLTPSCGALRFDEGDVSALSGRSRNVAQVFQFPVLYESLNVEDNLAFPLKTQKASPKYINERLDYICKELEISELRPLKPKALSLFQKQLVAVGKALVRPDVSMVLLDEPLTAVEPKTKWKLRQTLRKVQTDLKVTMIYVTHDQTEALTFADRVSVLSEGRIVQTGTPEQVYASPEYEFVGHFVGSPGMNFLPAQALGVHDAARAGFRPEWVSICPSASSSSSDQTGKSRRGGLQGTIARQRVHGAQAGKSFGVLTVATTHGQVAVRGELPENGLAIGDTIELQVERCVTFTDGRKVSDLEFV